MCLSCFVAGWSAYMNTIAPPNPSGTLFENIDVRQSSRNEVEALLREQEGKLLPEGEFVGENFRTVREAGEKTGSKSALSFVSESWTLRVLFDEKGIAIWKQLRRH
jgi:hypothetical protein